MDISRKEVEKFIKLTKEEMKSNPPTKADLIGEGEVQLVVFKNKNLRKVLD